MELRRIATTLTLAAALAGGLGACNGEDAGRAVDKGAKDAKQAGKDAVDAVKGAGKKAGNEVDKAVGGKKD